MCKGMAILIVSLAIFESYGYKLNSSPDITPSISSPGNTAFEVGKLVVCW